MKITLRGKNIEITEAIEEKVSEKLSKLDKYFIVSENVEAKVLVRTYPYGQKIEVTIPTEYVLLRAEVVDQDLYNAIDLVIDKLEGQIRKYKTRLNRKSKDNKLAFNLASIEPLEEEEEDVLVKTKTITPKPMVSLWYSEPVLTSISYLTLKQLSATRHESARQRLSLA